MIQNYFYDNISRQNIDPPEQIKRLRNAMTKVINASGRICQGDEFERVCLNDDATIKNLMGRIRNEQNVVQNPQNQNVPSPINQIKNDIANQIYNAIEANITNLLEMQEEQYQQGIQSQKALVNNSLESLKKNSISIDVNVEQFKEKIQIINKEREEIIKLVQDIIKQFEKIHSQNISQNIEDDDFQENDYQNLINIMKGVNPAIVDIETNLNYCLTEVTMYCDSNQNEKSNSVINDALKRLKGNLIFFQLFRDIFKQTIEQVEQFQKYNKKQYEKNKELQRKLHELQRSNKEFLHLIQDQTMQLSENEKKLEILLRGTSLNNNQVAVTNQLISLGEINDEIMNEITNLSNIIFTLFPIENQRANIQLNQETLDKMKSFINSIKVENQTNDADSQEQQWKRSLELFNEIYPKISSNSLANEYIKKSFDCILKIKQKFSKVKKQIEIINGSANRQAAN